MKGPHFLWRAETIVGLYCVLPGGGEILREGDGANFFGGRLPVAVGLPSFGCRRSIAIGRRKTKGFTYVRPLQELHGLQAPWRKDSPEAAAVYDVRLDPADYGEDINHDLAVQIIAQRRKCASWLGEGADDITFANILLILASRAIMMLDRILRRRGEEFVKEGCFSERMTAARVEVNRELVVDENKTPHNWKNPVWHHADGSVAEW